MFDIGHSGDIGCVAVHTEAAEHRHGCPVVRTFRNTLLRHLAPEIVNRLELRPVQFEIMHEIEYPGKQILHLFFLEEGVASMTTTFNDGSQVEVGMFGYESVIGISALMGTKRSLNRVYTQVAGNGYSCLLENGLQEFERGGQFQLLTLRYVQAQLVQALQSIACNAKHNMEQRLARWLLICTDRSHTDTIRLSQDFLAQMLGSTRPTVSMAAQVLKLEGLIDYNRGVVCILDRVRLEKRSCECYRVILDHLNNFAAFDSDYVA